MKNWIAKYRVSKLAHNTGWMLLGQGISLFIQAVYFVIIARSLGAQQYGAFIAAAAFTQILSPFVGFGGIDLLIKNVARDRRHFPVYWGNLLFMTLASGLASTAFVIAVARLVLPASIPLLVIVFVSLAELIFSRLIDSSAAAFLAIERLDVTAQLRIWPTLARLVGIVALAASLQHPTARHWSFVYLLTTIFGATLGLAWVHTRIGRPRLALRRIRGEFVQGMYFSTSTSAQSIYNDIDKTMLARMATLDAVGIYAVAYRFIDLAFLPVRSLSNAAYPGFFRAGQESIQGAISYMRRLLPRAAGYSSLASLCLVVGAPVIPYIFGSEYARTVEALRWLALLPLLKTIHFFCANTLTGSGHQGARTLIQVVVAGFNVLINLWLIPAYSWRGAAWSSVATDALLAALMCLAMLRVDRVRKHVSQDRPDEYPLHCMAGSPGPAAGTAAYFPGAASSVTAQPKVVLGRYVVVNADDFGLSRQVNEAILQAFEKGLISSATIMPNMPGFQEACQLARQHHLQGRIGLHLNLTSGKPLTTGIADCSRFCDAGGCWRPQRRVLRLTGREALALEAEIAAQFLACKRQGITPTHLDSHHQMHTELGISPIVVRMAKRLGIRAIRLARNCGPVSLYQNVHNARLWFHGLARTDYFGNARETAQILQTSTADVEVMVHPRLDACGRLIDSDGEALESRIAALRIPAADKCSYYAL
jgi:O-antigen/teichoic acid export membrane protein/predicted glycoside hydrolase/deacetylase ChbG (UPF0249 family)